tara:strand:+ start:588 stop:782 length:195 start_codon:yes stop_codon:yes gene_type:complete
MDCLGISSLKFLNVSSPGLNFKKEGMLLNISNNTKEKHEIYINLGGVCNYSVIDFDLFIKKNIM